MKQLHFLVMLSFCAGLILLGGCSNSDPRAKVSGKVTFKDQIVPGGTVVFLTEDGLRNDRAPIGKDGTYSSTNVPIGTVQIGVEPAPKGARAYMPKNEKAKIPEDSPAAKTGEDFVDIPMSLRDPTKSHITLKVEPGEQKYDITLTDTGESKGSGSGSKGSMKGK